MTYVFGRLYDRGLTVVGLDGVEFAVKVIVQRNKDLKFKRENLKEQNAIRYQASLVTTHKEQFGNGDKMFSAPIAIIII